MSTQDKVIINKLPTGVPGLDEILGGGLPEFSFNIIAGAPGSGKTTLAHQIVFANATPERPALYFTILGEPAIKMLRYQQQYTFFDQAKLNKSVRFINLSQIVLEKDLNAVLEEIAKEVEKASPGIVVVDSFRTVVRKALSGSNELELQAFIQRLALLLTSWQATTFLVGEYVEGEIRDNPVFTVSDGLLWLYQAADRNSILRKLQIMKLRGQASVPGLHTFRITNSGLQAFSRTLGLAGQQRKIPSTRRLSIGVPELDAMLGGESPKAIASWWQGLRVRENRSWQPNSLPRAYARGIRELWWSLKSGRKSMRNGRAVLVWIWKSRSRRRNSKSSTSGPWTSRWMKPCARFSTRSRRLAPSAW